MPCCTLEDCVEHGAVVLAWTSHAMVLFGRVNITSTRRSSYSRAHACPYTFTHLQCMFVIVCLHACVNTFTTVSESSPSIKISERIEQHTARHEHDTARKQIEASRGRGRPGSLDLQEPLLSRLAELCQLVTIHTLLIDHSDSMLSTNIWLAMSLSGPTKLQPALQFNEHSSSVVDPEYSFDWPVDMASVLHLGQVDFD